MKHGEKLPDGRLVERKLKSVPTKRKRKPNCWSFDDICQENNYSSKDMRNEFDSFLQMFGVSPMSLKVASDTDETEAEAASEAETKAKAETEVCCSDKPRRWFYQFNRDGMRLVQDFLRNYTSELYVGMRKGQFFSKYREKYADLAKLVIANMKAIKKDKEEIALQEKLIWMTVAGTAPDFFDFLAGIQLIYYPYDPEDYFDPDNLNMLVREIFVEINIKILKNPQAKLFLKGNLSDALSKDAEMFHTFQSKWQSKIQKKMKEVEKLNLLVTEKEQMIYKIFEEYARESTGSKLRLQKLGEIEKNIKALRKEDADFDMKAKEMLCALVYAARQNEGRGKLF